MRETKRLYKKILFSLQLICRKGQMGGAKRLYKNLLFSLQFIYRKGIYGCKIFKHK